MMLMLTMILVIASSVTIAYMCGRASAQSGAAEGFSDGPSPTGGGGGSGAEFIFWKMDGCPHCEKFMEDYGKLKAKWEPRGVRFTLNNDLSQAKSNGIHAFPTLQIKTAHGKTVTYKGRRDFDSVSTFIAENV